MFHDHHPVADLLGQISRSNAGSKSLVEFFGQIVGRIASRICWSNSWIKSAGQIAGSNCWLKSCIKSAGQTDAIQGPPLATLGARMGASTDGPKTGKDGRERGKEKPHAAMRGVWWLALNRAARWLVVSVAVFLKRDLSFYVIRKGVRFDEIATRQIFVTLRQVSMRNLRKFAPVFDDVSI